MFSWGVVVWGVCGVVGAGAGAEDKEFSIELIKIPA